ncbi:MAG: hypothetical protein IMF04_00530, partial [Proteobacteria bacterium]|nr:hypothetical protein [Pseudomonadota bacterium]
ELLEDDDSESTDIIEDLLPMLQGSPMEDRLQKVAKYVRDYEFEEALEELNKED